MTPPSSPTETFLRIERGSPDACELAALTSVLLARAAALSECAADDPDNAVRRTAGWRRLERRTGPSTPRSWRDDSPR
ncbi:acyl-CoA carboxylase subunit epsilon [Streptomyces sp. 351MFTsu5.1]|uniref:acyl-CoA carboxylase subunit epsilon n=1 Tax=Streptomyces sp. 351MFTsu5.1 TaxID=1172180 RepID=UPI00037FE502|nr:acyl-CoA carboxylase subunit epsilon [Streptomyces sp. 351MFTsu5.1]